MNTSVLAAADIITLSGGFQIPLAVLKLAWRLEENGVSMLLDKETLVVRPASIISSDDVALLKEYTADLKRLVIYTPTLRM